MALLDALADSESGLGVNELARRIEVNPSTASPLLLEALLRVTGSDPDNARRLATAISEWVGSASTPRPQEAMMAEYRAAGLDYGPPSGPVESLSELGRVLGMTPAVLRAIRPHLTLYGPPEPNAATSDPIVAAALALSSPSGPGASPVAAQASYSPITIGVVMQSGNFFQSLGSSWTVGPTSMAMTCSGNSGRQCN